jgi:hypothetical protein
MNEKQQPVPIIGEQPKIAKGFKQQLFGPWTSNDPKVQQLIVRTQPSSGTVQRRFAATYPPAPTISQGLTVITNGFEFSFNVVGKGGISGYNIYSSTVNNPAVAKLLQFQAQPPIVAPLQTVKIQDITAASPFYWIASVNAAGRESARVSVAGNPAPVNTAVSLPPGAASGSGSGGGRGGGIYGGRPPRL